ncbi:hypothetical protein FRC11_008092 [Ceratobasidium sp. 423]|nr:hypothetical protein FRC11_008092 [Ceratobasidium sp. 423]
MHTPHPPNSSSCSRMNSASQFLTSLLGFKPKHRSKKHNIPGGTPVVNTPPPPVDDTPKEPQYPEDQDLFGGEHSSIPVRQPDDELGPLPPVPSEISGSIIDKINELDLLPGVREIRSLIKQVLGHVQGDSKIVMEIESLESHCGTLFDFIEKLNSSSPEINEEVMRMRRELTNTLAHLNHHSNTQLAKIQSRIAILERTARCRMAYERIHQKFTIVQGAEILQILNTQQQMSIQQTRPPPSELAREIQASEKELQRIIRQETGTNLPKEMILSEKIRYRGNRSYSDGKRFGVYKGELMNGDKVAIKISLQKPSLHDDEGRNFGRVRDTALGLKYLHQMDEPCTHGSLRGENVLVKMDEGIEQGCLNGFALTKKQVRNEPPIELTGEDGICRWKAPEILDSPSANPPLEPSSDIWSWAMTVLQLYSGLLPYYQHTKNQKICDEIRLGRTPKREDYLDFDKYAPLPDKTWALLQKCWNKEPEERPTIQEVVDELDAINVEVSAGSD